MPLCLISGTGGSRGWLSGIAAIDPCWIGCSTLAVHPSGLEPPGWYVASLPDTLWIKQALPGLIIHEDVLNRWYPAGNAGFYRLPKRICYDSYPDGVYSRKTFSMGEAKESDTTWKPGKLSDGSILSRSFRHSLAS
jgi:hypothetical protein